MFHGVQLNHRSLVIAMIVLVSKVARQIDLAGNFYLAAWQDLSSSEGA
jgi:hypothetical protein